MDAQQPNCLEASWQEMLIELVRDRPCIFDKSHRDYHDTRGVKANNWLDICNKIQESGYEELIQGQLTTPKACQARWESLRDGLKRYLSALDKATRSGAGAKMPAKYKYYDQLEWLMDYNKKRITTSNQTITNVAAQPSPQPTSDEEYPSTSATPPPPKRPASAPALRSPPSFQSPQPTPAKLRRGGRENNQLEEQLLQQMSSTSQAFQQIASRSQESAPRLSNDELIGQMIGRKLTEIIDGDEKDELIIELQQQIRRVKKQQQQGVMTYTQL